MQNIFTEHSLTGEGNKTDFCMLFFSQAGTKTSVKLIHHGTLNSSKNTVSGVHIMNAKQS